MVNIALLGYGVVGSGVVELVERYNDRLGRKEINIVSILVRNKSKHRDELYSDLITEDINELLNKDFDILVEVMGGLYPTYEYVESAIKANKNIITANKDLIAELGEPLFLLAKEHGVTLRFEASVAGGIPIIKPLTESLRSGNNIESIKAILNGTTNFILTKMDKEGLEYKEALKIAQELGFAEANPEADVLGYDAARKLAILSSIAYDQKVYWKDIITEGITNIDSKDFKYANSINCKIKLVAQSKRNKDSIYAAVKPVLISNEDKLANVDNEFNSVTVTGDAVGELIFTGKGAGKLPTASAVFGDLIDLIENRTYTVDCFKGNISELDNSISQSCEAMIRISTLESETAINEAKQHFENVKCVDIADDEVIILAGADSENELENRVKQISNLAFVSGVKTMMVI